MLTAGLGFVNSGLTNWFCFTGALSTLGGVGFSDSAN